MGLILRESKYKVIGKQIKNVEEILSLISKYLAEEPSVRQRNEEQLSETKN